MKTLIAALLALTVSMTAASAAMVKEKDRALADSLADLHALCVHRVWPEGEEPTMKTVCTARDVLQKEMEVRGYCFYGRGIVGKTGGLDKRWPGRKHCYEITN